MSDDGHMPAHEHYREAERLAAAAESSENPDRTIALAGVHASLAAVGVAVLGSATVVGRDKAAWDKVTRVSRDT